MEAKARGEEVPAQPFDSNCITPGTEFMASLTQFLYYYIR
jgi:5'-3' exoribonuclease 1